MSKVADELRGQSDEITDRPEWTDVSCPHLGGVDPWGYWSDRTLRPLSKHFIGVVNDQIPSDHSNSEPGKGTGQEGYAVKEKS